MKYAFAFLSFFVFVPTTQAFTDVSSSYHYADAVQWAKDVEIVEGYSDGTFRPNNTINRAEFSKILASAPSVPVESSSSSQERTQMVWHDCMRVPFTDISDTAWFYDSVLSLYCEGTLGGYPDGTFRPENSINFVEAAKIIAITHGGDEVIRQSEGANPWYRVYKDYLDDHQAIPFTIHNDDQIITRGEMVQMMYVLMANQFTISSDGHYKPMREFSHVKVTNDANLQMQDAMPLEGSSYVFDKVFEHSVALTPNEIRVLREEYGNNCYGGTCDVVEYVLNTTTHQLREHATPIDFQYDGVDLLQNPAGGAAIKLITERATDVDPAMIGRISRVENSSDLEIGTCSYLGGANKDYRLSCYDHAIWSPTGEYIAFVDIQNWGDIVLLPANATSLDEMFKVGHSTIREMGGAPPVMRWTPDGKKIVTIHDSTVIEIDTGKQYELDVGDDDRGFRNIMNIRDWYSDDGALRAAYEVDGELITKLQTVPLREISNRPTTVYSDTGVLRVAMEPGGTEIVISDGKSVFIYNIFTEEKVIVRSGGGVYGDVYWLDTGTIVYIKDGNIMYAIPQ